MLHDIEKTPGVQGGKARIAGHSVRVLDIVAWHEKRGIDVLTAQDAVRCGLPDADQLQFATAEERVLVTFDSDYLQLAATGIRHAGIAYSRATKYSVGQLIYALLLLHGALIRDEM